MKNWKILYFIFEGIVIYVLLFLHISIPCFFKAITSIPCPGCGMTRAFLEIFNFHFDKALYYNVLSVPLFFYLLFFNCLLLYDILLKKNISLLFIEFTQRYSFLFLVFLIISWFVNIIHGI